MAPDARPPSPAPLVVVGDDEPERPVEVDTGAAGREETAVRVAWARMQGVATVRTGQPRAARRAAHVIDALRAAARPPAEG